MKQTECFLGIDVGSVSTNFVLLDRNGKLLNKLYIQTNGEPIQSICNGLKKIGSPEYHVCAVGTTGSGRELASVVVGGDLTKNEITTHSVAALHVMPEVRTILEIGGQDSKLILIRDSVPYDFAMNTVCAAGTGSFLDRQASRLNIPIETFGDIALRSTSPVSIAGRCAVFAESDMIHKQQVGHSTADIFAGLCDALVKNFLNNLAKGKKLEGPILFQGGVAANKGIVQAFENVLGQPVTVPAQHDVMGAFGAALMASQKFSTLKQKTKFRGFQIDPEEYQPKGFSCNDCSNNCEVLQLYMNGVLQANWGGKCGKWELSTSEVI